MFLRRLRYWFDTNRREDALLREMQAHVEERAAQLMEDGLNETQASAEARRRFGNLSLKQEDSREVWIARYWWDLWQDLRYAVRSIRRQPGFAIVAVLSATLGIGACSTVFGIVNFALFRPLPVEEPDRLIAISGFDRQKGYGGRSIAYPEAMDISHSTHSWEGVSAFYPFLPAAISSGGEPNRYWGFMVSANYFDVVKPGFELGRGFVAVEDDVPGAPAKVVLSHALWQSRFGADTGIVGRTIQINKRPVTVAGITRRGFRGTEVGAVADFFLPFSQVSELDLKGNKLTRMASYGSQWLFALGRLRTGVDLRQAQSELDATAHSMRERVPELDRERSFFMERAGQLSPAFRRIVEPAFYLLLLVTFLVLLTACANVANLMLARALARNREVATRLAIGAGRGRLVRQLVTESTVLGLAGGLLGVGLAELAGRYIGRFRLPMPLPIDLTISTDLRVILFSAALAVVTGLAFGLIPALRATRPDLSAAIKCDAGSFGTIRRFGLRNALVVLQVGISAVLLVCSGLFLRSLGAAQGIDTGMNSRNILLVRFDPDLSHYTEQQARALIADVLRDAESLPGASSASITNVMPLSIGGFWRPVRRPNQSGNEPGQRTALMSIAPRYFETMGIQLLAGADFRPLVSRDAHVIVNEALAQRLYPGQNALGRDVIEHGRKRIIGIVANSKYQFLQEDGATPILYKPILDAYNEDGSFGGLTVIIKAFGEPLSLAAMMRQKLASRDPELVVSDAGTMESHLREAMFLPRLASTLFGLCGGMGLLIASIGVYGVINFAVSRRTREIGIRIALGAGSSQVLRMVLLQGTAIVSVGIVIGVAGGLALAHAARSLIYGVSPTDSVTFSGVTVVLLLVALLATAVPARRASMVDPNSTLRAE